MVPAPPGYTLDIRTGRAMDLAAAAGSTLADPQRLRSFLASTDYLGGAIRVYNKGDDYAELLGFGFARAPEAIAMVDFQVQELRRSLGAQVSVEPAVPDGRLFDLFARTRGRPRPVFCHGIWYTVGHDAFEVLTCSSLPNDPELARSLATQQYQRVAATPRPTG
jgi:hypothetical protein